MASGRFRRFTKVEKLEEVGRPLLKRLFEMPAYAGELRVVTESFPGDGLSDADYYKGLAGVFRSGEVLPQKVADDLHVIDELAGIQEMDELRERFRAHGFDLPPAWRTVMEVVVELWLVKSDLVRAVHFDMVLQRLTGYEQFEPKAKPTGPFVYPGDAVTVGMRPDLAVWFHGHDRGDEVLVEHYEISGEHWFIVKHNEPVDVVRELTEGKTRSFRVHPLKDDVLVYTPETGAIRINARTVRERALYREVFAKHFFGSADHFYDGSTYNLAPLAQLGEGAMKLVPGMKSVVLTEIRFQRWGEPPTIETQKGANVFASFASRKFVMREDALVYHASFDVTFGVEGEEGDPKPRPFKIKRGNGVHIARDCDHAIFDRWLRANGYVQPDVKRKRTRKRVVARVVSDSRPVGVPG